MIDFTDENLFSVLADDVFRLYETVILFLSSSLKLMLMSLSQGVEGPRL